MTAPRGLDSLTGLRPGDHVCWSVEGDVDLAEAVVTYLDEGRRRGEQLLLVGGSRAELVALLADLPQRDALLAGGQLAVQTTEETSSAGAGLEPREQVGRYRTAVQVALDGGRPALRVVADVTALLRAGRPGRRRLLAYEGLVDALTGTVPMTGLCLYRRSVGVDALGPVAVLHPVQHLGDRQPLAHLSGRGRRLALHGEVDTTEAAHVRTALVDLVGELPPGHLPGEVELDVSDLDFIDVAGGRALDGARHDLAGCGIGLRVTGARRHVRRCLDLFDLVAEPA